MDEGVHRQNIRSIQGIKAMYGCDLSLLRDIIEQECNNEQTTSQPRTRGVGGEILMHLNSGSKPDSFDRWTQLPFSVKGFVDRTGSFDYFPAGYHTKDNNDGCTGTESKQKTELFRIHSRDSRGLIPRHR